jgi:hypothetical protein
MILASIGALLAVLGLPFFVRGLIFTLRPEHPISLSARERNLRLGLEVDMRIWGRKVRRFGFLLLAIGGVLIYLGLAP